MKKNWFKYAVISAVLLIPFMYAFFYLKAYWDPYGVGNMDNIPVAIVNLDEGEKGKNFAENLVESKKLDFQITNENDANDGIYNKKYYAVITIPKDFTENLESASKENKTTITYSPNQKTNYLASQIISRVLVVAEEKLNGEVSKTVVKTLTEKLNEVPIQMEKLSNGIQELQNGTEKLNEGTNTLNEKYREFDEGINKLYSGSTTLTNGITEINAGTEKLQDGSNNLENGVKQINEALNNTDLSKINELTNGITEINTGSNNLENGINAYVDGTNAIAGGIIKLDENLNDMILYYTNIAATTQDPTTLMQLQVTINTLQTIKQNINNDEANLVGGANQILTKGTELKTGTKSLNAGINILNSKTTDIKNLGIGINTLKENLIKVEEGTNILNNGITSLNDGTKRILDGSNTLNTGLSTLNTNSKLIKNGISELNDGSNKINSGVNTLNKEVEKSINNSKEELKKLDGLDEFVENPVTIEEQPINEINSYGTAFGPFFMSIALWVGSLMLFIVLYYDKNNRFKLLGENAENKLKRTACYLGLASLQGISLGILLMIGLDFEITNYPLYFISLILVSCLFESIMEFLIVNLKDVGKFLALILLVLQLAAAGGTFPIETVTKCFRFLNPLLPMKYTCDLFKETIISIEGTLLSKSLIVIIILFIILLGINIFKDIKENCYQK